jgi:hypothetical protein
MVISGTLLSIGLVRHSVALAIALLSIKVSSFG